MDRLFGNEAARRAYQTFWKFDVHKVNEISFLSNAHPDSIVATISSLFINEHLTKPGTTGTRQKETSSTERVDAIDENTDAQPKARRRLRGGRTPLDNIRKLKAYLP